MWYKQVWCRLLPPKCCGTAAFLMQVSTVSQQWEFVTDITVVCEDTYEMRLLLYNSDCSLRKTDDDMAVLLGLQCQNTGLWWGIDIHGCYSLVKIAFAPICTGRTIDEYDVTIPVSYICVTSQISCGDITILSQKRLSLGTMAKSAIENCFSGIVCSGHQHDQIACKK